MSKITWSELGCWLVEVHFYFHYDSVFSTGLQDSANAVQNTPLTSPMSHHPSLFCVYIEDSGSILPIFKNDSSNTEGNMTNYEEYFLKWIPLGEKKKLE